jgi:signal transduction histidine kinase
LFLISILDKKFTPLLGKIAIGTLIYTLTCAAGSALRIFAIPSTSELFHLLLSLIILVITYMTATSLFNGSKLERTFGISFVLLYIFIIIDIVRWYIVITDNFKYYVQWAMLVLIIIMAFSLIMQLVESQNKLKVYSEEIRLKEEVLEEKKKLLLEMSSYDKMKTEFFVNISHELRTPLNIILSTLQLINLYIDRGQIPFSKIEFPRYIKVMKQNCYRLLRLVNNVIDISKVDSGYMEPVFLKQDIVAAVEDTTLSTADYIQSNSIELCFDTDIEEKFMCFDREKIERVLLNLLSNAVKFSRPGSTITVELFDKKDAVCIVVKDTGIGIPKDTLQAIFERFVQADKSLSRSQEGSGIGLSLVKSLVEVHKGTIAVESEYGKGSTFTVTLPTTLPETKKHGSEELNLPNTSVEKVHIEFSDIYNF